MKNILPFITASIVGVGLFLLMKFLLSPLVLKLLSSYGPLTGAEIFGWAWSLPLFAGILGAYYTYQFIKS